MIRTPMDRKARIDLSRVPSSMENLAAGWAAAAKHAAAQADKQRRRKKPERRP